MLAQTTMRIIRNTGILSCGVQECLEQVDNMHSTSKPGFVSLRLNYAGASGFICKLFSFMKIVKQF